MKLFADRFKNSTTNTDELVAVANAHIDRMYSQNKRVGEGFLHALAVFLSRINIEQKNGGPFGAVIVKFEGGLDSQGQGIGKPKIIGLGANHVVPNNDPSAHAEMEAYRDAAKRQGYSDLRDAVLYTSCECCPMCLSIANGSGISKISYVNTRMQAELIDFSDKQQYDLFSLPIAQQMTSIMQISIIEGVNILDKLGNHGAIILDDKGELFAMGNLDTDIDPTGIASIRAVRNAVKKYADIQTKAGNSEPVFCLPYGYTLVCRDIPHPAGWVTADWARLLRKPDPMHKDNPAFDSKTPDAARIIHVTNNYEQLPVVDRDGNLVVRQDAVVTYKQPALPDRERAVRTERFVKQVILPAAKEVFDSWKKGISTGIQDRY